MYLPAPVKDGAQERRSLIGTHRILVISPTPSVLKMVAKAAQPQGWLLFQAEGLSEIKLRLKDLNPQLIVLDVSHKVAEEVDALSAVLKRSEEVSSRPLLMVLGDRDSAVRHQLASELIIDALIETPVDDLELAVEVRTLIRVRQIASKALRDRDILNQLFELSSFSSDFEDVSAVLESMVGRLGDWMRMPHVVVTLGSAKRASIAARFDNEPGNFGQSLVERRHLEIGLSGEELCINQSDGVLAGEDVETLPYIGLPLKEQKGEVLGVLHAWGGPRLPDASQLRVLRAAAGRIGAEIQLSDSHRQLEKMVETRTSDLTALLGRIRAVNNQLVEASRDTIMRLARAAEYRDGDTGEHVDRMSSYAQIIAKQMGMSAEEQALIKLAAPMHDIGKIGIPDSILLKQGKLTADEYDVMKQHPLIGARILAGSRNKLLNMAEEIAATHHEKWDGTGYPKGLSSVEIPLVGRIVALADVFDALTSPRVYKHAWSIDEAVSYIHKLSGKHFDPDVIVAFDQCLEGMLEVRAEHMEQSADAPPLNVSPAP